MINLSPANFRAAASGISSCPRWTPSARTASAMSRRSLTISFAPARGGKSGAAWAKAKNTLDGKSFARSWTSVTPALKNSLRMSTGARPWHSPISRIAYSGEGRRPGVMGRSVVFFHDDMELGDFFSQRVAVDAENFRRADLVAAGLSERQLDQRPLDALDHQGIEVVDVDALGALEIILQLVVDDFFERQVIDGRRRLARPVVVEREILREENGAGRKHRGADRSEEHTSELQSHSFIS